MSFRVAQNLTLYNVRIEVVLIVSKTYYGTKIYFSHKL